MRSAILLPFAIIVAACGEPGAAHEPTSQSDAHLLRLTSGEILFDGARVASPDYTGMPTDRSPAEAELPTLVEAARGAHEVRIESHGAALVLLDLAKVLRDLRAADVDAFEWEHDGRPVGAFGLFDGDPDVSVEDFYTGPPTRTRISSKDFVWRTPRPGPSVRVGFELDWRMPLGELALVMAPANGCKVRFWFHLGEE
jgi:hypothetical protein